MRPYQVKYFFIFFSDARVFTRKNCARNWMDTTVWQTLLATTMDRETAAMQSAVGVTPIVPRL